MPTERYAAALAPVFALTGDLDALDAALARTTTGGDGRLAIWLPDDRTVGSTHLFEAAGYTETLQLALSGLSFSQPRIHGIELWAPSCSRVATSP